MCLHHPNTRKPAKQKISYLFQINRTASSQHLNSLLATSVLARTLGRSTVNKPNVLLSITDTLFEARKKSHQRLSRRITFRPKAE
ncbi:hypothetical protein Mpe_A2410 [Methylibium petroleiphilum PM1]|uniref:Uncharacterized protein n=1 Tax=Methylibium petroleiphilum (strain ATCC BAA-1232 / LMG 22953 / PM1) TaxID=420662 RepID=A2SIH6_METPP|nr:hypothetical protein Mpe_A2410 [Methylibium petroleiphilum PM1]